MIETTASKRHSTRPQQQTHQTVYRKIDIRPLKTFAFKELPKNLPLRKVLLAERDILKTQEFLAKMETWLNLMKTTTTNSKNPLKTVNDVE